MSEGPERNIRLDDLEMSYYAEVASREELAGHLEVLAAPLRYGTSCRDVSVSMRQSDVGALAGLGASAFVQDVSQGQASSRVWRLDSSSLSVRVFDLAPTPFLEVEQHGWRVSYAGECSSECTVCGRSDCPSRQVGSCSVAWTTRGGGCIWF